jgi:thiosulfate reductase cytochrome b subunit
LLPGRADFSLRALSLVVAKHLRFHPPDDAITPSYNVLQRLTYLFVIFVSFPLVIWTGLAMSPAFDSAVPAAVNLLGGRQSARTLHFFVSTFLLLFVVIHIAMVVLAGFRTRMRAMIAGSSSVAPERTPEPRLVEVEERL